MKDTIVEETRRAREELYAEFEHDLHRLSRHFIELQSNNKQKYITREMIVSEDEKLLKKAD
ncbi:MAG: hypothetical protein AB9903_24600 [Vulcanimicrobiota bacterium]